MSSSQNLAPEPTLLPICMVCQYCDDCDKNPGVPKSTIRICIHGKCTAFVELKDIEAFDHCCPPSSAVETDTKPTILVGSLEMSASPEALRTSPEQIAIMRPRIQGADKMSDDDIGEVIEQTRRKIAIDMHNLRQRQTQMQNQPSDNDKPQPSQSSGNNASKHRET